MPKVATAGTCILAAARPGAGCVAPSRSADSRAMGRYWASRKRPAAASQAPSPPATRGSGAPAAAAAAGGGGPRRRRGLRAGGAVGGAGVVAAAGAARGPGAAGRAPEAACAPKRQPAGPCAAAARAGAGAAAPRAGVSDDAAGAPRPPAVPPGRPGARGGQPPGAPRAAGRAAACITSAAGLAGLWGRGAAEAAAGRGGYALLPGGCRGLRRDAAVETVGGAMGGMGDFLHAPPRPLSQAGSARGRGQRDGCVYPAGATRDRTVPGVPGRH
jgi:hypothetical protein